MAFGPHAAQAQTSLDYVHNFGHATSQRHRDERHARRGPRICESLRCRVRAHAQRRMPLLPHAGSGHVGSGSAPSSMLRMLARAAPCRTCGRRSTATAASAGWPHGEACGQVTMARRARTLLVRRCCFWNAKSKRSAWCKKLNSTETLIQRTTTEAPRRTYVLHRTGRSQEDNQLLREGCQRSGSPGRQETVVQFATALLSLSLTSQFKRRPAHFN
jgi:hypothetical protein